MIRRTSSGRTSRHVSSSTLIERRPCASAAKAGESAVRSARPPAMEIAPERGVMKGWLF